MSNQENFDKAKQFVDQYQSIVIALPSVTTEDGLAAATALYIGLAKSGKIVTLACTGNVKSDLVGADKIQGSMSVAGNSLIISFPYKEGNVDKVDYQVQGNRFQITVVPLPGQEKLDPKQVQFSYSGGKAEAIIVVDAPNLAALGALHKDNEKLFQTLPILNIDRKITNNNFGKVNLIEKALSSTSEIIMQLLQSLKIEIDKQIATNLYYGLVSATANFSGFNVNANSFQSAGFLFDCGAQRKLPTLQPGLKPYPGMTSPPSTLNRGLPGQQSPLN